MRCAVPWCWMLVGGLVFSSPWGSRADAREISRAQLQDRIEGGLLGQLLGNLNGLPHEMRYIDEMMLPE